MVRGAAGFENDGGQRRAGTSPDCQGSVDGETVLHHTSNNLSPARSIWRVCMYVNIPSKRGFTQCALIGCQSVVANNAINHATV